MKPLFEMPELLTISGKQFSDVDDVTSEEGGGCHAGCDGGCCGGCGGGGGVGSSPPGEDKPIAT